MDHQKGRREGSADESGAEQGRGDFLADDRPTPSHLGSALVEQPDDADAPAVEETLILEAASSAVGRAATCRRLPNHARVALRAAADLLATYVDARPPETVDLDHQAATTGACSDPP
jgi:hypothetical protein